MASRFYLINLLTYIACRVCRVLWDSTTKGQEVLLLVVYLLRPLQKRYGKAKQFAQGLSGKFNMGLKEHTLLYMIVSILHTFVGWLGERFSWKRDKIKKADDLFREAQKERDESKLTAALDKLRRIKK